MKVYGFAPVCGLWGVRCDVVPIEDEGHFGNVDQYILDHQIAGAVVWPSPVIEPTHLVNPMDDFDPGSLLLD
jgi:hypothetical protein